MAGMFAGLLGEDDFEGIAVEAGLAVMRADCTFARDHETAIGGSPGGTAAKQPAPIEGMIWLDAGIAGCQCERGGGRKGDCSGG